MTTLTPVAIYRAAREAGFDAASAVRATAIALAESGGRSDARGDLRLQTTTWGPSVGLMQIRTLKGETGKGTPRDITRLDDPVQNMAAAYKISSGGKDWTPWSTYKSGRWKQYLGTAGKASAEAGTTTLATSGGGVVVQPAGLVPGLGDFTAKLGVLATKGLFLVLGLGLVGGGVMLAVK